MHDRLPLKRFVGWIFLGILTYIVVSLGAVSFGAAEIGFNQSMRILLSLLPFRGTDGGADSASVRMIILQVRLPRVVLSGLVGMALSLSGAVLQAVFRNPLAEPYLLGISSGAGLGASIGIILTPVIGVFPLLSGFGIIGLSAFLGALGFTLIVYLLARVISPNRSQAILLAGVGLGVMGSAGISVLMFLYSRHLEQIVFWTMGSFSAANWDRVALVAPVVVLASLIIFFLHREITILSWGGGTGHILGMRVDAVRRTLLVITSLLTAFSVASAGVIGFVGLVVPHILRSWVGVDHRRVLPLSALGGGIFLILADTLARTLVSPREIPVGVLTALLGGPIFIWRILMPQGSGKDAGYEW